ncbi:NmrA family NAD(P)-binding protein [Zavarzinella formosa]|uniref:NmrA family NAD(P)-binding protein n=1 Tax=Zavarzinella formosa TaxID=360055 RepID=UPI0003776E69|nr:NmrA family NAD(P)-binding protein [Zavarzinella formosa]
MAGTKPKILILGATGQVGEAVIPLLTGNPAIQVVAATRSPEKWKTPGTTAVALDLDRIETIAPALEGVERAFLVTGYTVDMLRQSKDFLNTAKQAGVRHIVHLGACGDDDTRVDHYAWHQFIERYIEWCGFSFTHLRPEIFMQNLLGYGGESFVKQGIIRHFVGDARLSWVDCDDVAAAAAACLLDPVRHAGKTYRLGYEAKTFGEVAETFTRVLGQPFSYEARPPEEFLQKVLAAGSEPAYMRCVYNSYVWLTAGVDLGADKVFDNFPAITGRQPRTVADFAKTHADRFRY